MRYFLEVAYQGTHYHGWQIQANAPSIQAIIEEKLGLLLKQKVEVVGSGRTDTGVHAEQQFAHFEISEKIIPVLLAHRLNLILGSDIVIKNIFLVASTAHARFDAYLRSYEYRLSPQKNPFLSNLAYFDTRKYDFEQMNLACEIIAQYTDFQCFSKVKTAVNHYNCQIYKAEWNQKADLWVFNISANRFLRGMVRAIVGTLLDVGLYKLSLKEFEKIIQNKDRRQAGRAVPPEGLFLTEVKYPYELKEV